MDASIRFFTCADKAYEDFAPLYAAAVLSHVAGAAVEIGVEDVASFKARHHEALEVLGRFFSDAAVKFRRADFSRGGVKILPNTVRFLEVPDPADYVYIGDIDIIVLDRNFAQTHLGFMRETGLPYSNAIRASDASRMSGLHFARYGSYYPLPDIGDLDLSALNDEKVLRIICERKGLPINRIWFRPTHGIHVSPNRTPQARRVNGRKLPGWEIEPYAREYVAFAATPLMVALRPCLSPRITTILDTVDLHAGRACQAAAALELAEDVPAVDRPLSGSQSVI